MSKRTMVVAALASAIVMMFGGPASADAGRTVTDTYNFPAVGQGDLTGACFNEDPANPPQIWSCLEATPVAGETHVAVNVTANSGELPYISVQQDNNPNFAWGCGTLQFGDVVSDPNHPGVLLFPINDSGPGGGAADPVLVFAWAGPGVNDYETPPNPCQGSVDTTGGTGTFVFHTI